MESRREMSSGKDGLDSGVLNRVFEALKDVKSGQLSIGRLLSEIERSGIRRADRRLSQFLAHIKTHHIANGPKDRSFESLHVDSDTFQKLMEDDAEMLTQIFKNDLVIPDFDEFTKQITRIFKHCTPFREGQVANYIPQLSKYDPDLWACSVCTVDGQRISLGDYRKHFTLQSCSKPFAYAICLNELGSDVVHRYVGQEPSGRNFNDICLDSRNRPHNPMLNSGAIMISALCHSLLQSEMRLAEKFDFIKEYLMRLAGQEEVGFNNAVFLSERETADRNYAMAYLMREHKCFPDNSSMHSFMDLYFQFCSLELDTEALAVMGATLANGGVCPTTGERVLSAECIRHVLSLMYSCGMYNYSGEFAFTVGLPAKSGVSGNMVIVVPNIMAIALWSPPLDAKGNSVRGVEFARNLVDTFNLHRFDNLRFSSHAKIDPTQDKHHVKSQSTISLLFAATAGDVAALKRHLLQGHDVNRADYDGRTALHVAAAEGQLECVKFLLNTAQADPKAKDRWGFLPHEEAERFGHQHVATFIETFIEEQEH